MKGGAQLLTSKGSGKKQGKKKENGFVIYCMEGGVLFYGQKRVDKW